MNYQWNEIKLMFTKNGVLNDCKQMENIKNLHYY